MSFFKYFAFSFFLMFFFYNSAQNNPLNVQQIAHVPTSSFQVPTDLSDIWGWVDSQGNEYAIVGTNEGTSVFDLSDPTQPIEVFFEQGMNSIWRDVKTYGNYAYVTTEAQNGLLIIDLSPLPSSNNLTTYYYTGPALASWQSAHNLYIDDRGYAYIFGANRGVKGCIILDLTQNPTQPVEVADINNWYVHDGMVRGDTLYMAHISDGFFSIWDVSNASSPVLLGQHNSLGNFTHNAWVSDDGDYLYTTDEISNGYVGEYNISDLSNIELTDQIQTEPGQNVIPHNTHFLNNYLITSYYTSGIVVHDVSNKGNMVEVGSFDTSPNYSGNGFYGCWGVYPWLPSGLIIASDIEEGLYVLSPNYKRGAYLEGIIKDAASNQSINGVNVEILNYNESTSSNTSGVFKMGTVNAGTYDVVFSHPLYQNDTVNNVVLQNDSLTFLSQLMYLLTPLSITIETKNSSNNTSLAGVEFKITNDNFSYSGTTSSNGSFVINNLIPGSYNIYVGSWGFNDYCDDQISITNDLQPIVFSLDSGYYDRFNLDLNWTVDANALSGYWVRDEPLLTSFNNFACNPGSDSYDCGEMAYVTGNSGGSITSDDVDLGYVKLTSPTISLNTNESHYLHCNLWWKNIAGASTPDDTLFIRANDGQNIINLLTATNVDEFEWDSKTFQLPSSIDLSNFHIEVITADWYTGIDNVVEAGIDNFQITNNPLVDNQDVSVNNPIVIYPNPTADGWVYIKGFKKKFTYQVYTLTGKLILIGNQSSFKLDNPGIYLLKIKGEEKFVLKKIIF